MSLNAQTTSVSVSFSLSQSASYPDCMVTNAGTQTAFVSFGSGNSTLATLPGLGVVTATPVLAGESAILRKGVGTSTCAAITLSGSTTLYFTAGQGN